MEQSAFNHIVIIGTGRVAWNLCNAFKNNGVKICQVAGRNKARVEELAAFTQCAAIYDLEKVRSDADLYVLAVRDDALPLLAEKLPKFKGLVVHTSGMADSSILGNNFANAGVFYPLQTFSTDHFADFDRIPMFVQANKPELCEKLFALASVLSKHVTISTDVQRQTLHLAAVFVNNFTNALFEIGWELLRDKQLDFKLLEPLILETASKITRQLPRDAQTGPARRNDVGTIARHLEILNEHPDYQVLYRQFTHILLQQYHKGTHEQL